MSLWAEVCAVRGSSADEWWVIVFAYVHIVLCVVCLLLLCATISVVNLRRFEASIV